MARTRKPAVVEVTFGRFAVRMTLCHMVTYWLFGMAAFLLADYKNLFQSGGLECLMRPTTSRWVAAGPALQFVRGLIFTVALYPFRSIILGTPRGWLKMWGLLVGLAILSTAGPTPGSFEGFLYTTIHPLHQLIVLPEGILQTLALSLALVGWHRRPHRAWGIIFGALTVLVVLMSVAGVFLPRPEAFK
jgi:hypothetical protein